LKTLDFKAAWAPRFILYEQKHLGSDRSGALELLHGAGYRTADFGMDVFAFRTSGLLTGRVTSAPRQRSGS
jgi:hypothetical protein